MVRHGSGRNQYFLVVVRLDEADTKALGDAVGKPLSPIAVGAVNVIPLPLEANAAIGTIGETYYNAEQGRWTSSVAITSIK